MKTLRIALVLSLLAGMVPAGYAFARAYYTYKYHNVTTVTGRSAIECQYQYNDGSHDVYFWRTFLVEDEPTCPSSVEVE
jgi:hypothetical protein